jgi:NarL family two-component system sensor histidine kinase YdfH
MQWRLLCVQAVFGLVLTQISDANTALLCSLALLVAFLEILQQLRPILLASVGYAVLLFLYIHTFGAHAGWQYLWQGGGQVFTIPELLATAGLILYLQQRRAYARAQSLLADLHTTHAQLSAYALRVEELTALTERQRIARELHDTLVQGLAGMVIQLDVVNNHLQEQRIERARAIMPTIVEAARDTLTDARCALGDLRRASVSPEDLVEVLQEEIAHFTAETHSSCEASLEPLRATSSLYCEHIVRVVGEALANIKRHARAKHTWIETSQEHEGLLIQIRDDGIGFDPSVASTQVGHYGLLGIRERAKLIGGRLDIVSQPGQGTSLHFWLPGAGERGAERWQARRSAS